MQESMETGGRPESMEMGDRPGSTETDGRPELAGDRPAPEDDRPELEGGMPEDDRPELAGGIPGLAGDR
jgi:hypothetical protein